MTNYDNTITETGALTDVMAASAGVHLSHSDSVLSAAQLRVAFILHLNNEVNVATPLATKLAAHERVVSTAAAHTDMLVAFQNTLHDIIAASASALPTHDQIAELIDAAIVTGVCTSVLHAKNAIVEAIFAHTRFNRDFPASVTDAMHLHEQLQSALVTAVLVVDEAAAFAEVTNRCIFSIPVSDAVAATTPLAAILSAHEHVQDGVVAVLSFIIDGDSYTGVVLNTETAGVSEYQQYPFNSLAPFGGKYFGCAADGIYRLEGATDNGAPIESYVRTGLIRLADGMKARVPDAYFGYTSTGDLVMKVITTYPDGAKAENWYKLEPRAASSQAASNVNRVKIGRGLASAYWAFEIHSSQGSQFALDTVQLWPMPLQRRV